MTSILSRSSRFAVVAAVPFMFAARPLSAPLAGGTTYEFIVRAQTPAQNGGKETVMMRGRGTFAGTDGRIDILEAASQSGGSEVFGGKGSYFLLLDGGKKMLLVDPRNQQYMEWDMVSMMAGMTKILNAAGSLMKFEMSDVKIDSRNLGAGETIQGYSTVHYQLLQSYTITAKVFGRTSKQRSESTTDFYFAPALKGLVNPFMSNTQAWASAFDPFNNADYKTQMTAAQAKIQYGVPVKSVVKTVTTDEKGKEQTSTVTSEMVNFHNTDVPSSTFAIPAGYKKVEMPKMDANVAAGDDAKGADINADSLAAAAKKGAAEGVKEGVKEGAKESAAKKLKGIFKR